jgi:hypothetical protein
MEAWCYTKCVITGGSLVLERGSHITSWEKFAIGKADSVNTGEEVAIQAASPELVPR